MSNEYYVWNTELEAQSALDYINDSGWFPIIGTNALTGEREPESQQTTKWCDSIQQRTDGKWCFQRIPPSLLDYIGVTEDQRTQFLNAFNPTIEEYQSSWFLQE